MGAASAPAPNRFGKYTLVAKLAIGGMAEIFLARLSGAAGFEKLVCIKRILPHLAKDQNLVGMFLAEAKIAAAISHHNVCQVFELGEIDGRYFIAMEYLEGVPFSCFRRRDMYPPPIDPRLLAGLGVQACEGLHHAHQLKRTDGSLLEVVHRDVSSNNLFCTVDGVVKVLDFGIAKIQDASVRTSTGSVKGTYAYMAPEQLRGEALDRRTDVFAMGIVLWELFARRHLFKRDTDFLTFQAITSDPIPDVSEFRPDVPPQLCAAIAKALSRDRDQRFPSARALGEELAASVMSIGGPLSASQLSDVVNHAFDDRLEDQRRLIKLAREGGALDLADDLGPGVGHGTAMVTTPVSMLSSPALPVDHLANPLVPPHRRSSQREAVVPPRRSSQLDAVLPERSSPVVAPPKRIPSEGEVIVPPRPSRGTHPPAPLMARSKAPMIVLGLGIAAVAAVLLYVFVFGVSDKTKTNTGATANNATATDAKVVDPRAKPLHDVTASYNPRPTEDAGVEKVVVDAAAKPPPPPPADAAEVAVIDAAPVEPPDAAKPITPTHRHRPPPPKVIKKGPPGFITIDSAPVYAVIFVDGKRVGETPLPRVSLLPGRHVVRAVTASGSAQSAVVTIQSGKRAPTKRFRW